MGYGLPETPGRGVVTLPAVGVFPLGGVDEQRRGEGRFFGEGSSEPVFVFTWVSDRGARAGVVP